MIINPSKKKVTIQHNKRGNNMKNKKWNIVNSDNRPVWIILFVSRNKDNKHLDHFHERRQAFISKEPFNSDP